MLLGVRPRLGDALVDEGHRLRIYVPFGSHWYEYSLRRLQENPSIAGYVASDTDRPRPASGTERLAVRRRALALLLGAALVLAGCGASGANDRQEPPRMRPNSNQNPGYDGSG